MLPPTNSGTRFADLTPEQQKAKIKMLRFMSWVELVVITGIASFASLLILAPHVSPTVLFSAHQEIAFQLVSVCFLFGVAAKAVVDLLADALETRAKEAKGYGKAELVRSIKSTVQKKVVLAGGCILVAVLLLVSYIQPLLQAVSN
jgi:hypothetical protein